MVRSAEKFFAIEKMAAQGLGSKKITEAVSSSGTDKAHHIVPRKDTAQNTSLTRIRHSMALSADSTTDADNMLSYQNGPPCSSKVPRAHFHFTETPKHGCGAHFFYDRAANGRKHNVKRGSSF